MSVRTIPGRISNTFTPQAASRVAHSAAAMLKPALEMQYSPRFTEAAYAESEVTKTMRPAPRSAIQRAASLSNGRRLVVVKVSKPDQDMRFDVPVVGRKTIQVMQQSKATVLAVDAGKTLLFDRKNLIADADEAGIAIVGT